MTATPAARFLAQLEAIEKQPRNCFQCRHAQMLPTTDFTRRGPMIQCEAVKRPVTVSVKTCPRFESCPRVNNGSLFWNEASRGVVRQLWRVASKYKIAALLGRTPCSVKRQANREGVVGGRDPSVSLYDAIYARGNLNVTKKGTLRKSLNDEQRAYIRDCHERGYWPRIGGSLCYKEKQKRIKEKIEREVARLGPFAPGWVTIKAVIARDAPSAIRRRKRL